MYEQAGILGARDARCHQVARARSCQCLLPTLLRTLEEPAARCRLSAERAAGELQGPGWESFTDRGRNPRASCDHLSDGPMASG